MDFNILSFNKDLIHMIKFDISNDHNDTINFGSLGVKDRKTRIDTGLISSIKQENIHF